MSCRAVLWGIFSDHIIWSRKIHTKSGWNLLVAGQIKVLVKGSLTLCPPILTHSDKFIYPLAEDSLKASSSPGILRDSTVRLGLLRQPASRTEQLPDSLLLLCKADMVALPRLHPVSQSSKVPFAMDSFCQLCSFRKAWLIEWGLGIVGLYTKTCSLKPSAGMLTGST